MSVCPRSQSEGVDVTDIAPEKELCALLSVIEVTVFVDRATRSTSQLHDHHKYPENSSDLRILRAAYRNRTDDLRITSASL